MEEHMKAGQQETEDTARTGTRKEGKTAGGQDAAAAETTHLIRLRTTQTSHVPRGRRGKN